MVTGSILSTGMSCKIMKTTVKFNELKVGDLLARNLDSFMLGNRWVVESINSQGALCSHWWCGMKDKWKSNWWLITEMENEIWTDTDETLDTWKEKQFNVSPADKARWYEISGE